MATAPLSQHHPHFLPNSGRRYVWQWPVRLTHWINALTIPVLFATGIFIGRPNLTPMGEPFDNFWMGRIRQLHFVFAYLLVIGGIIRVYWFFVGNNYARSGVPMFWKLSWYKAVFNQVAEYMHLHRGQIPLGHNSLAGASYIGFFGMCLFEIVTGFAMYGESNRGGFCDTVFGWVIPLLGGSFQAHMWHHMMAWGFVLFLIFHIYIVLYDTRLYKNGLVDAIFSGYKYYDKGDIESDTWIS